MPETVQLDDRVYSTRLDDGPRVLSEHIPGLRSVAVGIWVPWGASHDGAERMGAAHLLEHMIFKGTERRSAREIALEIEGIGGALDAYTSREHTACHARVLDEHLPMAVDVLTDLIFHPLLRPEDLELERQVILEEIAGVEDTPEELVFDLHAAALWDDHPYGRPVLGTADTVRAISRDDLETLWRTAYRPETCVVAAAGNVSHEALLELVARNFPNSDGNKEAPSVPEPTPAAPETVHIRRDSAQVHICLGASLFPRSDPRRYAAILVSTALGGGMSSRLFQRVREELGLAYTVYSYQSFYDRGGHAGVYMATRSDTALRAVDEVREELGEVAANGMSEEELSSIKRQTKGQVVLSLESSSARLQRLAGVALYGEPYLKLDEICARIDAVSEAEVARICREHYAPERQTIISLGPDGGAAAQNRDPVRLEDSVGNSEKG
ncbi:MAG: insulinase family protein [Gemmatimonadetes bacterium]|uniref:Insulinase family protein n=1 Tax=Candidatus Kutchimonas denitrificans TaxID=3056748 RepID=A0AAE4ZBH8_9BACT|nr:insulinase family protein [Gemmatimonadota bacterium]NIR76207.1 insulinase family protein [Candidatus Kutchimonas denitrificans]NIS00647.1 insulinase family protein [Gemmatimonadota bacterium]NIT66792.1 insulinase family protein [Gemmatimonadota bacterium]NIV23391.1 insulinase family protein [Gemmatimonadota bacterium]